MTRVHAAKQLLALGPLTFREFAEITGWPRRTCSATLAYLREWGLAIAPRRWTDAWRLA